MIRKYKNEKIHRNLEIIRVLSFISLIISFIVFIVYLINRRRDFIPDEHLESLFYFGLLFIPFFNLIYACNALKFTPRVETKKTNDFKYIILEIILSSYNIIILIFSSIISLLSGKADVLIWANCCGRMLVGHIFSYIALGFLIQNAVLIKKEWKIDTPYFIKKEKAIKQQRKIDQTNTQNEIKGKDLIEKCGIRFFIKYYEQIKNLPLRDIAIEENYTSQEKEERLTAAKKIIDNNLDSTVLAFIIKKYENYLNQEEINSAKSLLDTIHNCSKGQNYDKIEIDKN